MEVKMLANTYLVLALLLGAMLPVMLSLATSMNTSEFLLITYALAVPASYALVVFMGKKEQLFGYLRNKKTLALIAAIGLLEYTFLEFGLSYAERFVSASLATVVYRSYPLLMLLFLPFVLKERITKYQVAALSLAFVGLYLALSGGSLSIFSGSNIDIIGFLIVVALTSALATALVKKYNYEMGSSMFIFNLANLAFFAMLFVAQGMPISPNTAGNLVPILYVGIIYNVLVGYFYFEALRMHKTTFLTNVYFLSPFITFVYSALILGEAIRPYYIAIAVLVTAGVLIQKLDKLGGSYIAKQKSRLRNFVIFDVSGAFANTGETAITRSLEAGGRVLAVSMPARHEGAVVKLAKEKNYGNVYTHSHKPIASEAKFVREIMGAKQDDMILFKVGDLDEGEEFFGDMSDLIGNEPQGHLFTK